MQLTHYDIKKILQIIDSATLHEIEFVHNGLHFRFINDTGSTTARQPAADPIASPASPQCSETQSEQARDARKTLIRAFAVGTLYRAPRNGHGASVETGTRVKADQTIAVIKTALSIVPVEAQVDGIVEHIFPDDGDFVEFDQPLFAIAVT